MDIVNKLTSFATKLSGLGLMSLAGDIDGAAQDIVLVGKELGSQGYWVRNQRCWQGCYRNKRANSPRTPAQKVWNQCLEEYQEAIKGKTTEWDKYANSESTIKVGSTKYDQELLNIIKDRDASGSDIANITFAAFDEVAKHHKMAYLDAVEKVLKVAKNLENKSLSTEADQLADELLKEAGLFDFVRGLGGAAVDKGKQLLDKGKQVGQDIANKGREWNATGSAARIADALEKSYQSFSNATNQWNKALADARTEIQSFQNSKNPTVQQRAKDAASLLQNIHSVGVPQAQSLPKIQQELQKFKGVMKGLVQAEPSLTAPPEPAAAAGAAVPTITTPANSVSQPAPTPDNPENMGGSPALPGQIVSQPLDTETMNLLKNIKAPAMRQLNKLLPKAAKRSINLLKIGGNGFLAGTEGQTAISPGAAPSSASVATGADVDAGKKGGAPQSPQDFAADFAKRFQALDLNTQQKLLPQIRQILGLPPVATKTTPQPATVTPSPTVTPSQLPHSNLAKSFKKVKTGSTRTLFKLV